MRTFEKFNQLAEEITNEIIVGLDQGKVFWRKEWNSFGLPKNYATGRYYEGFNALYLNYITEKCSYKTSYYLTFNQAKALGGNVRKGERGNYIVFWKIENRCVEKSERKENEEDEETEDVYQKVFTPFVWTVFNIDQIENVSFSIPENVTRTENQIIESCESIVSGMQKRPMIQHGGDKASYNPVRDRVRMPAFQCFNKPESYYSTLFHELIHSTGHASRLKRFHEHGKIKSFGDENYSKEELVAEIGASFINAYSGIKNETIENSIAYLQGWIEALRDDKKLIISASTKAFKAANFILNIQGTTE